MSGYKTDLLEAARVFGANPTEQTFEALQMALKPLRPGVCHTCKLVKSPSENLLVDPGAQRVFWKGIDVDLTTSEFRVIALLASKPCSYFSYRHIYDAIRDSIGFIAGQGEDGYKINARSAVKRIRRKFLSIDSEFCHIVNYVAYGYGWKRDAK